MTEAIPRDPESGIILVNVLSVLALASAVMVAILTLQDVSIERSTRFMDSASANALALGGETSAIVALRRDVTASPETDHYGEAWAAVQQKDTAIEGGTFKLAIEDEQARFNLNNLVTDGLGAEEMLRALLRAQNAPVGVASKISVFVVARGGLNDVRELAQAGIDPGVIARLPEVVCVLPEPTDINVNTAGEKVLGVALGNPAAARLLISRRDRQGFLTPADLASARVLLPARSGFRSDYFVVSTTVTQGTITQSLESHLHRVSEGGPAGVFVLSRQRNTAARFPEPPYPR